MSPRLFLCLSLRLLGADCAATSAGRSLTNPRGCGDRRGALPDAGSVSASPSPSSTDLAAELHARLLGLLSQWRLHSITARFAPRLNTLVLGGGGQVKTARKGTFTRCRLLSCV